METTDKPIVSGEITNTCTCQAFDPETFEILTDDYGDPVPSDECFGCWDDALNMFSEDIAHLWEVYGHDRWVVTGIQLWNREVGGHFEARNVADLVRGMTVNSAWSMKYHVYADRVEYSLSHHDALGSASVLRPLDDDTCWS